MERVLVVGATGNIGVAAITAALKTNRHVLALVRNEASREKLLKHVGTGDGITTVETDVVSENGVQMVVDQVREGKLPAFQHVYACVGLWRSTPMYETDDAAYRESMRTCLDANFFAYRATIPYLLQQNNPNSTWTLCTGAAGEFGAGGVTAITQGALFAMMNTAIRENEKTNVRVNEAFLSNRVDYDSVAKEKGVMSSSEYGRVYEQILERKDIDGSRVSVFGKEDLEDLKIKKKSDWKGVWADVVNEAESQQAK